MKASEDERMALIMENKVDRFDTLPDDVLSEILKRFPEAFLRYKAKYVCKRWFNIISTNRILQDDVSFIFEKSSGIHTARLVGIREGQQGLEVKEQNLDIPFVKIKSWYNEFLLITDHSTLIVFNLITNERSYLPQCDKICRPHYRCGVTLFFDRFKGVYKVVHFFMGPPFQCHILVLGSKINVSHVTWNWKKMEVAWDAENWENYRGVPVSVQVEGRYLHCNVDWSDYLVSVDMVKEEVIQTSLPGSDDREYSYYSIFNMGGFLGLIDGVCKGKADIWILKDFHRMEWEKLQSMNVHVPDYYIGKYPVSCFLSPICGVISKRYIIFITRRSRSDKCCSYDLKDGVVKELNIPIKFGDSYVVHSSAPNFI